MFLPRDDHWAAKRLPSCSCRNPGGGCSSAPLTHPSRWASHGPGTWRRGTSGAGGCRSFCEKLSHMILKNSRHLRKSQFQNHHYPQQLQETVISTNISVYSGSQGLNLFIKIVHNNEGGLRKAFQGRGDRVAQGEGPGFGVGIFGLESFLSQLCDFGKIT